MAKEIEWTETSIHDRFKIYQFWEENNKSNSYSEKLERLFNDAAKLISEISRDWNKNRLYRRES